MFDQPRGQRPGVVERRRSPSEWVCDLLVLAAALWTICCHAVVASGGSLWDVLVAIAIAAPVAVAAGVFAWRHADRSPPSPPSSASDPSKNISTPIRLTAVVAGTVVLAGYGVFDDIVSLWLGSTAILLLGFGAAARSTLQPTSPEQRAGEGADRWREFGVWAIGAACVLIGMVFHRADLDTPFYLSMVLHAADYPAAPLMLDTIHGIDGFGLHMPAHRIHSFETFVGALSLATGLPAIVCYQMVVASVSALVCPLAYARLFRLLTPRYWHWSVFAVIAVLVGAGGAHWCYGNVSIIRIFHGKSVYMSVFLPLIYAYGIRFGMHPTARRWLLLCAAQIAAIGCTSSALWSAPLAAGLAVVCAIRWDRQSLRTLASGALASVYVIGVGMTLVGDMARVAAEVRPDGVIGLLLDTAFEQVLGGGALELAMLMAGFATWSVLRTGTAQRFAIAVPVAIFVVILNPFLAEWISQHLTGPSYRRAMWSLPLPILMALLLTAPLQLDRGRATRVAARLTSLAAIWVFVWHVAPNTTLSSRNYASSGGFPRLNVQARYYDVAESVVEHAPAESMAVVPQMIALWVHSIHGHPYLSYSREVYLKRIAAERSEEEADLRMLMADVVSHAPMDTEIRITKTPGFGLRAADPEKLQRFAQGLESLDVRVVCLNTMGANAGRARRVLQRNFEVVDKIRSYEIWVRDPH